MEKWIKSSYCAADKPQCVEVSRELSTGDVHVRDGKLGHASMQLVFTAAEWQVFIAGVKAGEFDLEAVAV